MLYSQNFHKKILEIQAKENLPDKEVASLLGVALLTVTRWHKRDLDKLEPFDLERLLRDVHDHPNSLQGKRSWRLGISRQTVRSGLKEIEKLSTRKGTLYCCINNWLNDLFPEEKKNGELLRFRTVQAFEKNYSLLDLSQLDLRSLPTGVLGQLSQLRILDLRGNLLTTLAGSKIAELKRLQYLYLGNNLLTSSEELCRMSWLQRLDLENNPNLTDLTPLQKFPEKREFNPEDPLCSSQSGQAKRPRLSLTATSREQRQDLNNPNFTALTFLQEFPRKMKKEFYLIERLQQDVQNFPYASPNERVSRLGAAQEEVYPLLRKIDEFCIFSILHYRVTCWLDKLPEEERNNGRLFYSRIKQLYKERFYKKESTQLYLSQLSLSSLPEGVLGQLSWLRILDLSDNFLNTLVGSGISELKNLRHLDLSGNFLNTLVGSRFFELENLQHLDLSDNLLTNLAGGGFTGLRKLQILNLSSNLLNNVEELSGVYWLQMLNLANNPTLTDRQPLKNFPGYKLDLSSIDVTELSSQIQPPSELRQLEICSEDLDTLDVVESWTATRRPPRITPFCSDSLNLRPGKVQGSPSNEPPIGGNFNAIVAGSTVGSKNWGTAGSVEPEAHVEGLMTSRRISPQLILTNLVVPLAPATAVNYNSNIS